MASPRYSWCTVLGTTTGRTRRASWTRERANLVAAVRETWEETGLHVVLGPRLLDQHYTIDSGQHKVVAYWAARPPAGGGHLLVQAQ